MSLAPLTEAERRAKYIKALMHQGASRDAALIRAERLFGDR